MSDTISDKVLNRIRAMLERTVANGCTEAEASAAALKAQEVLAAHNLTLSDLEAQGGGSDADRKRERAMSARSAMYDWQVDLMKEIARANFCKYWVEHVEVNDGKQRKKPAPRHALIGRQVNVISANVLYDYLLSAMTRLAPFTNAESRSRAAHSWRMGCAERLTKRIADDHEETLRTSRAEKARAAREAQAQGQDVSTALTIADVHSSEEDLNEDAFWELPAGTTARNKAESAARVAAMLARWATEPRPAPAPAAPLSPAEEAKAKKREEAEEAAWKRRQVVRKRQQDREEAKIDRAAYNAGAHAAGQISLNKQVDEKEEAARIAAETRIPYPVDDNGDDIPF